MSLTKYNVEIDTEADKIEKPASRWRNRWKARKDCISRCVYSGSMTTRRGGEVFQSEITWPSKEVAEQKAIQVIETGNSSEYLGAFPEGRDAT